MDAVEFVDGTTLNSDDMRAGTLIGADGTDTLNGFASNDILSGMAGDDNLRGYGGNDTLDGGAGKDYLYGGTGDDTLSGGTGENDYLSGEAGDDTYLFAKGDGNTTISDNAGVDTIKFMEDISKDEISFTMINNNLNIQYGDDEHILIQNQNNASYTIENFELSDGNFLNNSDLDLMMQQLNAYAVDNGIDTFTNDTIRNNAEMMNIVSSSWQST